MNLYAMGIFSNRFKTVFSIIYGVAVVTVLILSVVRVFIQPAGAPRSRASTMSLGMSAKSLVFLAYEVLTEHVQSLKRWGSLKAYFILNALDVVFWGAVAYMIISAALSYCEGVHCILGWVVVALAVCLNFLAQYLAMICFLDWRYAKNHDGMHRPAYYNLDSYEAKSIRPSSADNSLMTNQGHDAAFEQAWPRSSPNAYNNSRDVQEGAWEMQPKSPSRVRTRNDSADTRGQYGSVPRTHGSHSRQGSHSRHHSRSSSGSHGRHGQSRNGSRARDPNAAHHHYPQQQVPRGGQYAADTSYHGAQNNRVEMPHIPSSPQSRPNYPAAGAPPSYYNN